MWAAVDGRTLAQARNFARLRRARKRISWWFQLRGGYTGAWLKTRNRAMATWPLDDLCITLCLWDRKYKKITIYASRNPSFFSSVTMHATSIWYRCARLVYRGPGQRSYGTWVRAVVRGLCEW